MWLGKTYNRKDIPFDVKWPQRRIYALGTAFSYNRDLCETENFTSKINKLQKPFPIYGHNVTCRCMGRILTEKTLYSY